MDAWRSILIGYLELLVFLSLRPSTSDTGEMNLPRLGAIFHGWVIFVAALSVDLWASIPGLLR
ncbi:hypothetical protein M413DRAFT_445004 [Hebeloma cylindrosporum]|uniref:DUF3817 domain-containing protein n=1 Tax=Hebeloma cylindrosporum TaxID=76867 RepID=A0A0C3BYV5_HEBCY|nr:hypothetical protein M413DRAFT_445004 [Hebeloma cylindrosporum h7]